MTAHATTTIDALTTALTGIPAKRAATKAAALKRFTDAARDKGLDGDAILSADSPLAALVEAQTPAAEEVVPFLPLRSGRSAALAMAEEASPAPAPKARKERAPKPEKAERGPTKIETVIAMMRRPDGATISEIMEATGWLPHTTRAAISATVKKKVGLEVTTEKAEGRGLTYKTAAAAPQTDGAADSCAPAIQQ